MGVEVWRALCVWLGETMVGFLVEAIGWDEIKPGWLEADKLVLRFDC